MFKSLNTCERYPGFGQISDVCEEKVGPISTVKSLRFSVAAYMIVAWIHANY